MERTLNITKSLSDRNRLRALMLLRDGELCVCRLISLLNLAPSTVSKHMSVLKQASLVEARREGKWTYYRLPGGSSAPAVLEIIAWTEKNLDGDPLIIADGKALRETVNVSDPCNETRVGKMRI